MTPGARLQETIDILDALFSDDHAADRFLTRWFRKRRYAGSKDRRDIRERVYFVLRHDRQLTWWMGGEGTARSLVLSAAVLADKMSVRILGEHCDGEKHRPAHLSVSERERLEGLEEKKLITTEQPVAVRCNISDWLYETAFASLGEEVEDEFAVLAEPAPVDLRVNSLKSDRAHATAELAKAGIAAENTRFSPLGLRLSAPQALDQLPVYRSGQVEIQDEGSQLVSLLCDAQPGMNVLDLCAGAGGKSLALAAQMKNQGAITLADIDETRLGRAAKRLERADVTVGEFCPVGSDWEAWCAAHAGLFDRVLVDVPCTGSGAWRRHPEARRRLTENGFSAFLKLQQELLRVALPLVKSGGRLIYATCSFFADENEKQIETLLAESDGVALLSAAKVWQAAVGGAFPGNDPYLRLSTYRHGTDGFFAAILERRG